MAKISFTFDNGKNLEIAVTDSDIEQIMHSIIPIMREGSIPAIGREKSVLSHAQQHVPKQTEYKELMRAMPTNAKILPFIKSRPNYEFNRQSLELHFFPDEQFRERIKDRLGRKFNEKINSAMIYARNRIAELEDGTWTETKEGNRKTWRFEKK